MNARKALTAFQSYVYRRYANPGAPPSGMGKSLIQRIADAITADAGNSDGCVDPTLAGDVLGVRVRFAALGKQGCGMIAPAGASLAATVVGNPDDPVVRFTAAHELGHACFFNLGAKLPERIVPPSLNMDTAAPDREEYLCDDFARALLLPERFVRSRLVHRIDLAAARDVARAGRVSTEVAIRRIALDLHLAEASAWYLVTTNEDGLHVRTLRQGKPPKGTKRLPTQSVLLELLSAHLPIGSRSQLLSLLSENFPEVEPDLLVERRRVWLRLSPSLNGPSPART